MGLAEVGSSIGGAETICVGLLVIRTKHPEVMSPRTVVRVFRSGLLPQARMVSWRKCGAELPYRLGVGVAVFRSDGRVWIGKRIAAADAEEGMGTWWQMPQGGLKEGEDPEEAARRELWEETSMCSVRLLGEVPGWFAYDLPPDLQRIAWGGRYRGQKQKWFAFRFEGHDSEIDVHRPGDGKHKPEFGEWRWEQVERLPELVVGFKRQVYAALVPHLRQFAERARQQIEGAT